MVCSRDFRMLWIVAAARDSWWPCLDWCYLNGWELRVWRNEGYDCKMEEISQLTAQGSDPRRFKFRKQGGERETESGLKKEHVDL